MVSKTDICRSPVRTGITA